MKLIRVKEFIEKNKENIFLFSIFFIFIFSILFISNKESFLEKNNFFLEEKIKNNLELKKEEFLVLKKEELELLKKAGCREFLIDKKLCNLEDYNCLSFQEIPEKISCKKWSLKHMEKPENIKAIYFTSYAALSEKKKKRLFDLVERGEINSVVIDIKEVDGKVAFDMSDFDFAKIKPISNNIIKKPKELIKELHQKGIYVIGRLVVFKDKILAEKRPDLAIKTLDKKTV
jgi:hypothetical protein